MKKSYKSKDEDYTNRYVLIRPKLNKELCEDYPDSYFGSVALPEDAIIIEFNDLFKQKAKSIKDVRKYVANHLDEVWLETIVQYPTPPKYGVDHPEDTCPICGGHDIKWTLLNVEYDEMCFRSGCSCGARWYTVGKLEGDIGDRILNPQKVDIESEPDYED